MFIIDTITDVPSHLLPAHLHQNKVYCSKLLLFYYYAFCVGKVQSVPREVTVKISYENKVLHSQMLDLDLPAASG